MKQLVTIACLSIALIPGLSSCQKDFKDKNSNAYKILGGWTPQKYTIRYTDFNGQAIVYERTTFDKNIWEFNKKKLLYIYLDKELAYSYDYSINNMELTMGGATYKLIELNQNTLNYLLTSPPNDTARIDGKAVGIIGEQEWYFTK
ncbi:MAG: hypothetical protein EOP54_03160 [Sphingobacteriales bacterium]|nr:MAG: hypothetical protein EOP54_03160 [Sphingobacteriales bacterium]